MFSCLPLRTDAVYLLLTQPVESVDSANGEGSREGRGNNDGDHVQSTKDRLFHLVVLHLEDRDGVDEPSSSCVREEEEEEEEEERVE